MKKIILIFTLSILSFYLNAQLPCNWPEKYLLDNLNQRPVLAARPSVYIEGCNVTDSVKKLLLYRARHWEWTEEELDKYINHDLNYYKNFNQIELRAKEFANGVDSIYVKAKDSITKEIKDELLNRMVSSHLFGVEPNILLTLAWLNMKEAIPFLRDTALNDGHYNKWAVEMALAKFGDKKLQRKIIENEEKNIIPKLDRPTVLQFTKSLQSLTFIGTQYSIFLLHHWIDTSWTRVTTSSGNLGRVSTPIIVYLQKAILNPELKELIKKVDPDEMNVTNELLAVKNWMIRNKGKYIINKKYCAF